jgi:hypothetical protein
VSATIDGSCEIYRERMMFVIAPCRGREISAGMIDVTDICEGFQGEDIITYECPICGLEHKSTVYSK